MANIFISNKSYAKELNENDTCKCFNNELHDIKLQNEDREINKFPIAATVGIDSYDLH